MIIYIYELHFTIWNDGIFGEKEMVSEMTSSLTEWMTHVKNIYMGKKDFYIHHYVKIAQEQNNSEFDKWFFKVIFFPFIFKSDSDSSRLNLNILNFRSLIQSFVAFYSIGMKKLKIVDARIYM